MNWPLLYLFVSVLIALRWPLLSIGLSLTFVTPGILEIGDTTIRVILVPVQVGAVALHAFLLRGKDPQILQRLSSNTGLHLASLVLVFLARSWSNLDTYDILSVKLFSIFVGVPVIALTVLIRKELDIVLFLWGAVSGSLLQSLIDVGDYYEQSMSGTVSENARLGMNTVGTSRLLVAGWLVWTTITCAYYSALSKRQALRIPLVIASLVGFATALLSGTRSAFASLFVATAYLLLAHRRYQLLLSALAGLLVVVGSAYFASDLPMFARLQAFFRDPIGEATTRLDLYYQALFVDFPQNPILGTGSFVSGNLTSVVEWDRNLGAIETEVAYRINYENVLATLLVETGVIGFAIAAFLILRTLAMRQERPVNQQNDLNLMFLLKALLIASLGRAMFAGSLIGAVDLFVALSLVGIYRSLSTQVAAPQLSAASPGSTVIPASLALRRSRARRLEGERS